MFVRKKKNKSGSTSIQIIQKQKGKYKVVKTIGSAIDEDEIELLYQQANEAIPELFNQLNLFDSRTTSVIPDIRLKLKTFRLHTLKSCCKGALVSCFMT